MLSTQVDHCENDELVQDTFSTPLVGKNDFFKNFSSIGKTGILISKDLLDMGNKTR